MRCAKSANLLRIFLRLLLLSLPFLRALFFLCSASSSRAAFLSFSLFRNFKILGGRFKSFAEDLDSPIMFVCCGRFPTKGGRGISLDFFFGGEMFRAWKFLVGRR